jgi:hypothetical protein
VLSAGIGHLLAVIGLTVIGLQRPDDPVQVVQDLLVHLGQPQLPVGAGGGEQPPGLLAVLAVLNEERWGGDEDRGRCAESQSGGCATQPDEPTVEPSNQP